MGILWWIAFGLLTGMTAKFVLPGRDPGGIIATTALGVGGALLGGFLGTALGFGSVTGFDFRSMMIAVFGSISILFGFRLLVDRSKA
jgi:uncharacterized membrane protein YeaQ/YmgE (transglycosylase-associated protein family)